MSTVTPHSTLHRPPLGRTFVVAISLLGVFAAIQILAVIGHFIPTMRQQLAASALQNRQAYDPAAQPSPAITAQAPAAAAAPNVNDRQKVTQVIAEAERNYSLGDYEAALRLLEEAEAMQPNDPQILRSKALIFETLDQPADAVVALETALRHPGLPSSSRAVMERKLDQLSNALGSSGDRTAGKSLAAAENPGAAMEENGIPVGSTLGIVDIRLSDAKVGTKNLQIAVKSREGASIVGKNLKVVVYFYEENPPDGEIRLTETPPLPQWMSPPIDWADNLPELLRVQYTIPPDDTGKKYIGYVVGIYYNDELQDYRSEPSKLAKDFPLSLFLKQGAE